MFAAATGIPQIFKPIEIRRYHEVCHLREREQALTDARC